MNSFDQSPINQLTNKPIINNIVLTGFMGSGKSTVGRALAQALNWSFVDLDALIESRQGRSIRQIFAAEGEAYFRQLEAGLCLEAAGWQDCVIATGGGTLVNPDNLAALSKQSFIVCLDCEAEALWQRLAAAEDRPMLDGDGKKERLFNLLRTRQPAYAKIPHHIDTTNRTVDEITADIRNQFRVSSSEF